MFMFNFTSNFSDDDSQAGRIGAFTVDAVLLLTVLLSAVLNVIVIAALESLKSELVQSIRVILINILVACILGDLGSVVDHLAALILPADLEGPTNVLCNTVIFFNIISTSGRVLFAAYYALTVVMVVTCWNKPVLAPRNTKYFIIAAVFVWIIAIIITLPTIIHEEFSNICANGPDDREPQQIDPVAVFVSLPSFIFTSIPIIVTPILLIVISCYIKCHTIRENKDTKKALVRFGFFLMVVQGINAFVQIVLPLLLVIGISSLNDLSLVTVIASAISDLTRIPTNILMIAVFRLVRGKVKKWMCCCCGGHCYRQTTNTTQITA